MTSSGGERGDWIVVRQLEGMPRRKPGRSRGRRALASRGSLKCGNPANRRVIESTGVCSATEDVRFNYQLTFLPSLTAERRAVPIRKSAARKLGDALDRASPSFRRSSPRPPLQRWNSSKLDGGGVDSSRDICSIFAGSSIRNRSRWTRDDTIYLTRSKVFSRRCFAKVKSGPCTRDTQRFPSTIPFRRKWNGRARFLTRLTREPRSTIRENVHLSVRMEIIR